MKSIEFQKFIDLVTFDQSLVKIETDIKKSQEIELSLQQDIQRLEHEFAIIKSARIQARKAVDEKELYMKVLDEKESAMKKKLELISNQKEYKSLQKESLSMNVDRMRHEQDLLTLWNKLEALEKNYEEHFQLYNQKISQFHNQVHVVQQDITNLKDEFKKFTCQRITKEQDIPQEWLQMYGNMKGRVYNPVIPVVNEACDACFYSVTSRDLQILRQNQLLQCRDCYRLLYIQEK